jgi:pimeloyl-ACP methyl ester carboxylesterase
MSRLICLQLVCGILARHNAWQRQTLHFGHINGDKYTVLICDNRGSGGSDKPWFCSTSEMAKDLVEVLDHVGWADPRSIHVAGLSMGGMIMQELALLVPSRIATLNLCHTAARIEQTWAERAGVLRNMFRPPPSMDQSLRECASTMFDHHWLLAPDDCRPPRAGMPGVVLPECGEYRMFPNNYMRYAAQEINRQRYTSYGAADGVAALGHIVACLLHNKTDRQLVQLADRVGRERLLVLHTTQDRMIGSQHGERLMRVMQPGVALMNDEAGHVPKLEKAYWFNDLLEERVAQGERLTAAEKEEAAREGREYTGVYETPRRGSGWWFW